MLDRLRAHPFAMQATLERTTVLTYAAPKAELQALLPPFLEPDTFQDHWGFVAMALVRTRHMRPLGFPAWSGRDLWLIGHRIFVRYTNAEGRRLRGLYIIGSETDKRSMACLGNLISRYLYSYKPMQTEMKESHFALRSMDGSTVVRVQYGADEQVPLPEGSVFNDWTEARRFVGPLPFTFSHDPTRDRVLIVEGSRQDWTPRPARVEEQHSDLLAKLPLSTLHLSNAFTIAEVPYTWKRGRFETIVR